MLMLGLHYRWESLGVVLLHVALVAVGVAGLGIAGLGIDFLRSAVDPSSPPPRWPLGIAPPADWPPWRVVIVIAIGVVALALLNAGLRYAAAVSSAHFSQRVLVRLRSDVYDKLQRLSFRFFDASESSSLINRAAGDVQAVRTFVDGVLVRVLIVGLTLLIYLIYMLRVHVLLTLACLAASPLLWIGSVWFSRVVQPAYRQAAELVDRAISTLVENVQGAHVVKGFSREPEEIAKFQVANDRIRRQRESIFWQVSVFQPIMGGLTQVNMLVLIGYGGYLVIQGQIPLGAGMFVMANLLHEFANQVGNITNIANTIQTSLIGAQRVFEVIDTPEEITSPENAVALPRAKGELRFENVAFGYVMDRPVLEDVSFVIQPGECIGIAGETGSGKSTLLALISRFYDPTHGAIYLDGHKLTQLDLGDLRRNIGIVFQESFLFSNTVAANIAFGHPDATPSQIEQAARLAAAEPFICELPDQYDTLIGEHGSNLSGGQRQRLAIARALLLDPPILVLDDATAAVDPETEHEIQQAVDSARERRTTILVSNRVSTLRRADRILVLQRGRIVESGSHDELMRTRGYYHRLAELQFGDLLESSAQ
ncbi:MAG: ABC transporter ATP-binding protein [Planctomycetales bacterium]|nr:ABC transporter ATP-binding protein [Planctomycetales bacterium]